MKLSDLLASRRTLIRQATLANMAHAYATLLMFAERSERARLRGTARLRRSADPEHDYWAELEAVDGSEAVLAEHFVDDDAIALAEALAYAVDEPFTELEFEWRHFRARFVLPLERAIERAGVAIDDRAGVAIDDRAGPPGNHDRARNDQ